MMRGRRFWIGLLASLLALWLATRGLDWAQLASALARAQWWWILPALPLSCLAYAFRAERVRMLVSPIRPVTRGQVLPAQVIGFLFNNILPGRLGEFVFAFLLGKRTGISRTSSFAVVVLSRVLDGVTSVAFFLLGLFAFLRLGGAGAAPAALVEVSGVQFSRQALLGKVQLAGVLGSILFAVASAACFALIVRRDPAMRSFRRVLAFFPARFAKAGLAALEKFINGLEVLRRPGLLFAALFFNFVPWGVEMLIYRAAAPVFGLALGLPECAFIMGMANLAMVLPSGPAGVGIFEWGGMMVLALLGVAKAPAFVYIVLVHALIILPVNIWGTWFLWREGISMQEALGDGRDALERADES